MQRIAIDMDGVLADVYHQFFEMDEKDFGQRRPMEEVTGKPEREGFPNILQYVYRQGFFRTAPVMEDSRQIVEELNKKYDLYIVSAATEFPQSLPEKQAWLNEHFPFITWQQMVFCGSKQIIQANIMIDDHFRNLDHFKGETSLLYTQPHNVQTNEGRHKRVNNWKEIAGILL
ncbi:MAG: 5' nucleotidase, NT5C type [Chitinophagaceae bacterium]